MINFRIIIIHRNGLLIN